MSFVLTPFEIAFPLGLGALFGLTRYLRMQQAGEGDALRKAALDGLKGVIGAGVIMFAYKFFGVF